MCYEWAAPGRVVIDCGQDNVIHVMSIVGGRKASTADVNNFCRSPNIDVNGDCFKHDKNVEKTAFQKCSLQSSCNVTIPFVAMDDCEDSGYAGQKYYHVEYECISRESLLNANFCERSNATT